MKKVIKAVEIRILNAYYILMTAKEIMRLLKQNGWYICETKGSHYQLKHDVKSGKITIPFHNGDLKPGTLDSILKQAGLKQEVLYA